jgi:hypothetical protein
LAENAGKDERVRRTISPTTNFFMRHRIDTSRNLLKIIYQSLSKTDHTRYIGHWFQT